MCTYLFTHMRDKHIFSHMLLISFNEWDKISYLFRTLMCWALNPNTKESFIGKAKVSFRENMLFFFNILKGMCKICVRMVSTTIFLKKKIERPAKWTTQKQYPGIQSSTGGRGRDRKSQRPFTYILMFSFCVQYWWVCPVLIEKPALGNCQGSSFWVQTPLEINCFGAIWTTS